MFLKPVELLRCMEVNRFWAQALGKTQRLWECVMGPEAAQAVLAAHSASEEETSDGPPREATAEAALQRHHKTPAQALHAAAVAALRESWRQKFDAAEKQRAGAWGSAGGNGNSTGGISLMASSPQIWHTTPRGTRQPTTGVLFTSPKFPSK